MLKANEMKDIVEKRPPLPKFHPVCFACNEDIGHGLKLKFWYAKAQVFSRYTIPSEYDGYPGISHGGIVAAILDETAAWAINILLKKIGFTQNFSITYLKPIKSNEPIFSVGSISSYEEDHVIIHSHIKAQNDSVLVDANSTWRVIDVADLPKVIAIDAAIQAKTRAYLAGIDKYLEPGDS